MGPPRLALGLWVHTGQTEGSLLTSRPLHICYSSCPQVSSTVLASRCCCNKLPQTFQQHQFIISHSGGQGLARLKLRCFWRLKGRLFSWLSQLLEVAPLLGSLAVFSRLQCQQCCVSPTILPQSHLLPLSSQGRCSTLKGSYDHSASTQVIQDNPPYQDS